MRIAQLVESLAPGGAQRLARGIAATWAERGHDALLVAMTGHGAVGDGAAPGVRVRVLGGGGVDNASARDVLARLQGFWSLEGLLRRERVDVLQTHLPGANFLGLAVALRRTCRVFPTVHNTREFAYGSAARWRRSLRRAAYRALLTRCPAMIAVSTPVREAMLAELGDVGGRAARLRVVPNGVRIPARVEPAARARARADLGVAPDEVLILAAGRMTDQKNLGDLLAALARLDPGRPWRGLLAGEGPERPRLQDEARRLGLAARVAVPGHLEDMAGAYAAADVFCLPSLWEGRPLVLLEAMAAGLPAVANRIEGVGEIVTDGRDGLLCPPGDADALARRLGELVADPGRRRALGEAARATVAAHHDWDGMMDRLERICLG